MLTYIPVSFLFSLKKGFGLGFGFGIGNLIGGAVGTVGWCARKTPVCKHQLRGSIKMTTSDFASSHDK